MNITTRNPDQATKTSAEDSVTSAMQCSEVAAQPKSSSRSCLCLRIRTRLAGRRPTLLLKSILLLSTLLLVNALLWALAGAILSKNTLGLALIAWSLGLRHAVDADHITVIDNTVRRIIGNGTTHRTPVTTGLFFSLGHSTVVLAVIIAIAASLAVAGNLDGITRVGSIIGPAVSGSMLMILALLNAGILYANVKRLLRLKRGEAGDSAKEYLPNTCVTRAAWPLLKMTDQPWKLYPVGLLFSLGLDTASSLALLSVALVASSREHVGDGTPQGAVVLLAFLFTSGMCLIDSADSIMMCYVYSPSEAKQGWRLLQEKKEDAVSASAAEDKQSDGPTVEPNEKPTETKKKDKAAHGNHEDPESLEKCSRQGESSFLPELVSDERVEPTEPGAGSAAPPSEILTPAIKLNLLLTFTSILIAFTIGLIQLMGLIGSQCTPCSEAADRQREKGDGGLAGRWWKAWEDAGDNSTYIGIAIIAFFALTLALYASYGLVFRLLDKRKKKASRTHRQDCKQPEQVE